MMRLLIITACFWALALAKPEMYKESEDFQYSRSSSDDGTKSGFYGAQRGNMGGNYEKAHNMDSMAQHHMSTLVRQIDGELGQGANTKTGSVFTAGNSRGIYGSGNYDLSNLKGRNFGENGYEDSQSQSSLYQNARQGNSYFTNSAGYGSEQAQSSKQSSGYSSSNLESQYTKSNLESENKYHGASNYDYGALSGTNKRYYSFDNSQARGAYDQSNTNLHSSYDLSNQNRQTSVTPVKIYLRPGERVALPISAPSYTLYSSNLQDKKVADTTNVLSNSGSEIAYKPVNNAKHYESAYSYHKKWEKHDTQPVVVVPTENPFPANSELYEDRRDETGQRYQTELDSSNTHLSNSDHGYSAHQNYQSGTAYANAQSSKVNSAYSSGYSANTKTASAGQARYQSEAQNKAADASSNSYLLDTQNLGSSADLNNLVEDIHSRPKSYHSSFSYHKAWERRGDPYVITPTGDINRQTSQKLISQNQGQFSSQQYGSHYNQKSYSNIDCDALCHQRRKRSYNINQYDQQDINNEDINLGQQSEDGWDLGQQTENKFDNLEDLGQATQNTWDNVENLGQQTQNQWNNLQNLGQETQNKWNNFEDNLGQQTQNNWDHLTEFGQQAQSEWSNRGDLGQQTENLGQETQNHFSNIEDLGQQTQGDWSKLEDLGQQTQNQWGDFGHESTSKLNVPSKDTQSKMDNLGQETQSEWDGLGQQTQKQWGVLEDLGQQTQTNWGKLDFGQTHTGDLEDTTHIQTAVNNNNIIDTQSINHQEKEIPNVESNEPAKKFLWDIINQVYEEPSKTENSDRIVKNSESLLNNDREKKIDIEILPTDKLSKDNQLLSPSNKNIQTISTNNKNQESSTDSLLHSTPKDITEKQKHENTPTNPGEVWQNQLSNLDQQSENIINYLGQQSVNEWSNLGQQSENQWSNWGQQSENQWGISGQHSETQWSNMGQLSDNHWSNLSQQSETQWSNLGQQSENQWSNLGHQSKPQWSNLGQKSETQWSNLGQQSNTQWNNLDQQSVNQWSNLGQQNQNVWSQEDQQTQFFEGHDETDSSEDKATTTETKITHNAEDQKQKEIHESFLQVQNVGHNSQSNKENQLETMDTEKVQENKVLINGNSGNHNVKHQSDGFETTSSKLPNKAITEPDTTDLKTSTAVPRLPQDVGRGDIGADDESDEFGGHIRDEPKKPSLIIYNLPSTTMKPANNEYRKPYNNVLNSPTVYNIPAIRESTSKKPKIVTLPSQHFEEQNEELQPQFEQQNFDLQQTQEDLSVLPVDVDFKTAGNPFQNPSVQQVQNLENVPLEKIIQRHDLSVSKHDGFEEQETKHEIANLESATKKHVAIETPLEPTTEKPGFWGSLWKKTKNAKSSVVSWFKN